MPLALSSNTILFHLLPQQYIKRNSPCVLHWTSWSSFPICSLPSPPLSLFTNSTPSLPSPNLPPDLSLLATSHSPPTLARPQHPQTSRDWGALRARPQVNSSQSQSSGLSDLEGVARARSGKFDPFTWDFSANLPGVLARAGRFYYLLKAYSQSSLVCALGLHSVCGTLHSKARLGGSRGQD